MLRLFGSRETLNPTGFIRKRPVRAEAGRSGGVLGSPWEEQPEATTLFSPAGRTGRISGSPREGEPRTLARASPPSHPCEDASCRGPQVPGPTEGPSTE